MNKTERGLIFTTKTKKKHRIPITPQPINSEYIKLLTYKDNFNKQGYHMFKSLFDGRETYVRPLYRPNDILRLYNTEDYILIEKVEINRVQDWDIEKMTLEGKNSFEGKEHEELYRNVLIARYKGEWDEKYGDNELLLYENNPWVWEITFSPTVNQSKTRLNRRGI